MTEKIQITSCTKDREITISYIDVNHYFLLKLFKPKGGKPIYRKVIINKTGKECINMMALRKTNYIVELKGANFRKIEEIFF